MPTGWRAFSSGLTVAAAAALLVHPIQAASGSQDGAAPPSPPTKASERTTLNGEIELARLVDLCAAKLGLTVEYDASAIKGAVTVRLGESLTDEELWALANELLASRGFATVRRPGSNVLSVVKSADATAAARIERPGIPGSDGDRAGFVQTVVRAEHRDAKDLVEAMKSVLSKPSGSAALLGDRGLILVSDFQPRIEQAMYVKSLVDVPSEPVSVETVPVAHLKPQDLITTAIAASSAREEAGARKLRGKLLPSPDGAGVVVMAPPADAGAWREILAAFDRKQELDTRSYTPRGFTVAEVSQLVQQIGRDAGPHGSGERWKLVADELTGTLVVTATPSEHAAIAALIARLDATPGGARRQLSIFTVRNRPVSELLALLEQLLASGSLSAGVVEEEADRTAGPAPLPGTSTDQRTERDVMPPGNALSVLATPGQPGTGPVNAPPLQSTGPNGAPVRAPGSGPAAGGRTISQGVGPDGQPLVTVSADEATNSLIIVAESRIVRQVEELLSRLDVRKAQVMLEVLVTSLNDDQAVELGVELEKIVIDGNTLFSLTSLFGLRTSGATPRGEGFTGAVLDPGSFSVIIRALEKINKGKTLNMPRVLVGNNQSANLTSVLQQPVLSTNASVSVATTSFGGTQDAGTTVTVKPQIAEGDHLLLDYAVAISSFIGTSTNPSLPPPRQQNTLQSVVAVPDGFTVAVGGLQIDRDLESISQIPLVGDIPIIGEAFKSRNRTVSTTRFFVFLRASILRQQGFEDLKYLSGVELTASGVGDRDFPTVEPQVIR